VFSSRVSGIQDSRLAGGCVLTERKLGELQVLDSRDSGTEHSKLLVLIFTYYGR